MKSKGDELAAAEEALEKMEKENGARGMSKAETKEEIDMLTSQVEADTKYIKQVRDALAEKKKEEWKWRQELRLKEQEAISKAISILHSDDARDLFKKSFESQGYLFLQEKSSSQMHSQQNALQFLKKAAAVSKDARLLRIASQLAAGGHFDEVIAAIDKMVAMLKEEEADDLKQKRDL